MNTKIRKREIDRYMHLIRSVQDNFHEDMSLCLRTQVPKSIKILLLMDQRACFDADQL